MLNPVQIASKARNARIEITCPFCGEVCQSKRKYLKHQTEQHPDEPFHCKVCLKEYKTYNGCYKHEQSHLPKKHHCPVCGQAFTYKNQLDRHMPNHDPSLKVPCEECGKGFGTTRSLTRHKKLHLGLEFTCKDCGKVFNAKEKLTRHHRGAHGVGYTSACSAYHYKWPGALKKHETECDDCDYAKGVPPTARTE